MLPPGSPQGMVPRGEDWIVRRFEELERKQAADIASMNAAAAATSAAFAAQLAAITALVGGQIASDYGYASGSNYALPAGQPSRVTRASFVLTVPTGFTKALISATAQDTGTNSTAGFDYLLSYVLIGTGGSFAWCPSPTTPAGYSTTSLATMTNLITGLTGGATITVASQPYTNTGAWATSTGNGTIVSATCLYLR